MATKRSKNKKYIFTLKFSASPTEIFAKYDLIYKDSHTTTIDMSDVDNVCYADESKRIHKCMISKIDFSTPSMYSCFWDRNPFTTQPIGCPIKYVPTVITREYFSEITKDRFSVKEATFHNQKIAPEIQYQTANNNYYETDGIFCSFSCCLAFIRENKRNLYYSDSEHLTHKIFYEFFKSSKIVCAPDWRMLKEYGGALTIEEFRANSSKIDYDCKGFYKPFKSVGVLYEEKIKF